MTQDKIWVADREGASETDRRTAPEDVQSLLSPSVRTYRYDREISLSAISEYLFTIPSGSIIRFSAFKVTNTIEAGGTSTRLLVGQLTPFVHQIELFDFSTFSGQELWVPINTPLVNVGIHLTTTTGDTAGDTIPTKGTVRLVIIYETPEPLE